MRHSQPRRRVLALSLLLLPSGSQAQGAAPLLRNLPRFQLNAAPPRLIVPGNDRIFTLTPASYACESGWDVGPPGFVAPCGMKKMLAGFKNYAAMSASGDGLASSKAGSATTMTKAADESDQKCVVTNYSLSGNPKVFATQSTDTDKLWVGSILSPDGLSDGLGSLRAYNLPAQYRQDITLTTEAGAKANTVRIAPTVSGYNDAIKVIRSSLNGTDIAGTVYYQSTQSSSSETTALQMGLNARYLASKASLSVKMGSAQNRQQLSVVFYQNVFTVAADLKGQHPIDALIRTIPMNVLDNLSAEGWFKKPPVWIDSVTYGRSLFLTIDSAYRASDVEAALKASYEGGVYSGGASLNASQKKVLSDLHIQVTADGGNTTQVEALIRSGHIADYFTGLKPETLKPISFTVKHLRDNAPAAAKVTTEYGVSECGATSMALYPTVELRVDNALEDNVYSDGDEMYGTVKLNGQTVWQRPSDQWQRHQASPALLPLYPEDQRYIWKNGAEPFKVQAEFDGNRQMNVQIELWDNDAPASPDFLGSAAINFDVSAVARQFRDHPQQDVVELPPFLVRNGKGFDSWAFVKMYRSR